MSTKIPTIDASPRKSFFIDMFTRDLDSQACILDLIDNSIDWIIKTLKCDVTKIFFEEKDISKAPPLSWKFVKITLSPQEFSIEDNGDGISEETLRDYAFRFGSRPWSEDRDYTGLSVYWVWMKRAFFKLGKQIELTSIYGDSQIDVKLDIPEWRKDEDSWKIPYSVTKLTSSDKSGTKIIVTDLLEEIMDNFSKKADYEDRLFKKIETTYSLFIELWLEISINGRSATKKLPEVLSDKSKGIDFGKKTIEHASGVEIRMLTGVTPDVKSERNGWYVFCNWRLVLEADKTYKTGWWFHMRAFHSSLNPFIGFVMFSSQKVSDLPWTTTKDDINFDNSLYQGVLKEISSLAETVTKPLARRYGKANEDEVQKEIWEMKKVNLSSAMKEEDRDAQTPKDWDLNNFTQISYQKETEIVDELKEVLWVKSASRIGEMAFDHYYKFHTKND